MRTPALVLFLTAILYAQPPAAAPPVTMTTMIVRLESTEIPKGHFATEPRVFYRAGTGYCRIEEMPDPAQGIHGLMIINEPDVWMVNLFAKSARHVVDQGPTYNCRLPVFTPEDVRSNPDMKHPLMELEFGREHEYFKSRGAKPQEGPVLTGKPTTAYATNIGDSVVMLITLANSGKPYAIVRQKGGTRDIYWYGAYEEIPFDPKLFAKPTGMKIEEMEQ